MAKHRISLYLDDGTVKNLSLAANRRKGAKSALVEEALDQYLNPERRRMLDEATLRRMDRISSSVSIVARDVAIATETLSLFVIDGSGKPALVNYRVKGSTYIVDRLFAAAELRLGTAPQQVVRIVRTDAVWKERQE